MLTESEALEAILSRITPLPLRRVALADGLGGFAAEDVRASHPLPSFNNSAMDGYAVRHEDTASRSPIRVIGEQAAGSAQSLAVERGTAVRIFTGAPMPEGADAVIMQEDTEASHGQIVCTEPVERLENVRLIGCDLCAGQRIVECGYALNPQRLAVLASQGLTEIAVSGTPRVAIVTTGDELVPPGQPLQPGQIYNTNGLMLASMVRKLNRAEIDLHHVPDELDQTTELLRSLTASHDFILLSGGVSVGDHDHVKPALEALGIMPIFWRVKIKPGKPLLFAQSQVAERQCTLFGLPGNPVSSFVTWQLFVRPALLKASGASASSLQLPAAQATLTQSLANPGDRPHFVRGRHADGQFTPLGAQQSHALFGLSQCNALMRMNPQETCEAGELRTVSLV
jgi:molybdopterin molybdotransferase